MSNERRFSDEEVALIIQRAAEGGPGEIRGRADGTSLAELKSIGAEVGIDPARIEAAAHALVQVPEAPASPLLGAPTTVDYEVRVPGEIPPESTPEAIAVIRRITGMPGKVSELHGTTEWRADGDMGSRWVTVSSRDGHTTVRASARLGQGAAISFIPTALAAFASLFPVLNAASADGDMMSLVLIPLVLAVYLATRGLWSRHARKEARQLRQVVEELGWLAESVEGPGAEDS